MFEWSSPYPSWVYLSLVAGSAVLIAIARRTAISDRLRKWWLFLPRFCVMSLLIWILLNPVNRSEQRLPDQPAEVDFLIDSSRSMALEQPQSRSLQVQQSIQNVDLQLRSMLNRPRRHLFRFGQHLSSVADLSQLKAVDNKTRLADALENLPSRFSRELPRAVVIFSDGAADDAERLGDVAVAYRELGLPIHVYPIGNPQIRGDVAIDELVVPPRVDAGVKVPIRGVVRSSGYDGERLVLQVRAADRPQMPALATLPITLGDHPQPFEMIVEANPEYGDLVLEAPAREGEVTLQNNAVPFQLAKASRKLKVLYMEGTGGTEYRWVRDALQEDKDIECVALVADQQYVQRPKIIRVDDALRGFPTTREELLEFDCVICSDISIGAFTREQLEWTVELVSKQGGGFMMVGGITSFGAGGWDQTAWDQLIPVDMTGGTLGRGWLYHNFHVRIPDDALTHPIWKIVEESVENRRVLERMPPFGGTNYILRLKPAATVLAFSATPIPQAGIMPIFACQPYGRGRTFAFAPDTTADWGKLFESQWGEGDNRYFRRFWRNAVRWLTENSIRGNKRLQIETDRVIYHDGQTIQITARAFDEQFLETMDYDLTAKLVSSNQVPGSRTSSDIVLNRQANGKKYTGAIESQSLTSEVETEGLTMIATHEIELIASEKGKEIARTTARISILPDLHELIHPLPRPEVLQRLAEATGGKTLQSSADLVAVLRDLPVTPGDSIISRQPLWDKTWLWLTIVTLLAIEWSLRRLSGYA